ncbi:MAG: DAK2 domain-containing protein, partial [Candidatus Eremiobacteraeota bacterium]|nr:DAK2 domain-containing protein [Candidatus Eremiobacteraeota bacterium]
ILDGLPKDGGLMDVTSLDGRAYAKFLTAGTYFLRKYRQVLNDLNVFPVPDGDTGTNMYLTVRSAALEAGKIHDAPLSEVAAAAAHGSLMGARGNSGVIISQMLRGFAHHVRHRSEVDTFILATGMKEAVAAARAALLRPVEGTIISVAEAAAEAAYREAIHEPDLYRFANGVLRAANEALDRTPDQLPVLKEAGVVDSGGAGFVYFLEGVLRFLPDTKVRATLFPRRPVSQKVFTPYQIVGENKFCTEFILEKARCSVPDLRSLLEPRGESVLVIGAPPTIKVHIHTDDPARVQEIAASHGELTRVKVDNMEQQHNVLVVDKPSVSYSIVAVVPGPGFERIARELGAEVVVSGAKNPSVRDLLLASNKCLSENVYLFVNDKNVALAAREVAGLTGKTIHVLPTVDPVAGIAGLFAFRSSPVEVPSDEAIMTAADRARSARVFFAGKDATVGGVTVAEGSPAALAAGTLHAGESLSDATKAALDTLGAADGGLVTLYYGGVQTEKDARRMSEEMKAAFPDVEVEYYYGGMKNAEFWISIDE